MAEHTPGPWRTYGPDSQDANWIIAYDGQEIYVSEIAKIPATWNHILDERKAANARLIAAAPDLLAACEAALEPLMTYHPRIPELDRQVKDARGKLLAAIAKAKGE
jgi:hypothetical protein